MTKATDKHDPAEASLPATRLPDAEPPEEFSSLVGEYPGLAIAAGLGLGLLAGALLPRSAGRKIARGVFFLATTGGELGLVLGKQALRKADDVTRESREKIGETAAEAAHKAADAGRKAGANAQRIAGDASERARGIGVGLARMAIDAAARIRH
ncbi:MAG: hypothetical protein QM676_09885 [Novosphingobium sp.]